MKNCIYCHAGIDDGAGYCPECGEPQISLSARGAGGYNAEYDIYIAPENIVKGGNPWAGIVSFIFSLLGLFMVPEYLTYSQLAFLGLMSPAAVILGIIDLIAYRKRRKGLAIAGIVIGAIGTLIFVAAMESR